MSRRNEHPNTFIDTLFKLAAGAVIGAIGAAVYYTTGQRTEEPVASNARTPTGNNTGDCQDFDDCCDGSGRACGSGHAHSGATPRKVTEFNVDKLDVGGKCLICQDSDVGAVFVHKDKSPGHVICCYSCADKCFSKSKACPYCKRDIASVQRVIVPV